MEPHLLLQAGHAGQRQPVRVYDPDGEDVPAARRGLDGERPARGLAHLAAVAIDLVRAGAGTARNLPGEHPRGLAHGAVEDQAGHPARVGATR